MPDLPQKKVGIVACSGEEMAEGTVTRLAALKVLEQLRPADTVTICLPLFLAGGEGDRAFARFYPTIAIDGCDKRCAARATEQYSGKPAASVVVTDLAGEGAQLGTPRRLSETGRQAVDTVAEAVAPLVDNLLGVKWNRRTGQTVTRTAEEMPEAVEASCSCGSGIPVLTMTVDDRRETLIAVPAIFDRLYQQGKRPGSNGVAAELLEMIRLYNSIDEAALPSYQTALLREFESYCWKKEG
ncbi:MAG: putative zinc-binding protein [Chloroflexota bacterium]